ncbi:SAM-dependent chlorinase/fluorinase [Oleispirillum naphthae]|uniref:SAM hydrolase/SAM-dependent halogenase family protein n=1 Tax=Oleispirillum naphthae TaxID=2838853 RepID=UPI0030822D19
MPEGAAPLLALFSDFGASGPYVGQVLAAWAGLAPAAPRVDLFSAAPPFDVEAGAHLLFAYTRRLPPGSVVEAVVDPGVGGPRGVLAVLADGLWFCGPDNGLLAVAAGRARGCRVWRVDWRPQSLSATFHGRDLFAPVAAHLALHGAPPAPAEEISPAAMERGGVADPAERVILADPYGNLVTGIPAAGAAETARLAIAGRLLPRARRFGEVNPGEAFWYENADGLAEAAVNRGSAAALLGVSVGAAARLIRD